MLKDTLPPRIRGILYTVLIVAGLLTGAVQAGFMAAGLGQPVLVTVAINVLAYLGTATGLVARAHVPSQRPEDGI